MNIQYLALISGFLSFILLLIVIWQSFRLSKLDRVRREFFTSSLGKDLEQILIDQNRAITKINQELTTQDDSLTRLYKDNRQNLQKVGFLRFNPFDDAGGNISFVLAMLNAKDEGVVISSLHGRDGTRIYAKEVLAGKSESKLTDEEIEAIKNAH